jgi:hypothetical protein
MKSFLIAILAFCLGSVLNECGHLILNKEEGK